MLSDYYGKKRISLERKGADASQVCTSELSASKQIGRIEPSAGLAEGAGRSLASPLRRSFLGRALASVSLALAPVIGARASVLIHKGNAAAHSSGVVTGVDLANGRDFGCRIWMTGTPRRDGPVHAMFVMPRRTVSRQEAESLFVLDKAQLDLDKVPQIAGKYRHTYWTNTDSRPNARQTGRPRLLPDPDVRRQG